MEVLRLESLLGLNWKRRVATWCGVFAAVILVVGIGVFGILIYSMKSSWAYTEGFDLARHNKQVVDELGLPIECGFLPTGAISVSGDSGEANLAIPIYGSKNSATVYVVAHRIRGQWEFEQVIAQIHSQNQEIDLLKSAK